MSGTSWPLRRILITVATHLPGPMHKAGGDRSFGDRVAQRVARFL